MPWVITNGKTYVMRDASNHIGTTNSYEKAIKFADRKRADSYRVSLPKTLKNLCFYPHLIEEPAASEVIEPVSTAPKAKLVTEVVKEIKESQPVINNDLLDMEKFVSQIKNFQEFVIEAKSQRELLFEAQKQCEAEIIDIEHAAEFYNLNAAKGYKMFRRLRDARVRRRQYKDTIAWIDILMESNPSRVAEANIVNRIRGMERRQYEPRALPELFVEEHT